MTRQKARLVRGEGVLATRYIHRANVVATMAARLASIDRTLVFWTQEAEDEKNLEIVFAEPDQKWVETLLENCGAMDDA